MSLKQPIGQKRLTNIAVVRYKKCGKKFEIACYRNTVLAWRNKVETDIDEVLQTHTVFTNVSKGVLAKKDDLKTVFGTDDQTTICKTILEGGQLQVSDRERAIQQDSGFRDVVNVLVDKCVNAQTLRPYPPSMLEKSLRDLHFNLDPTRSCKVQALEVLPLLQKIMPIQRARMRLRIQVPGGCGEGLVAELQALHATLESKTPSSSSSSSSSAQQGEDTLTVICAIDPGAFRRCDEFVRRESEGKGRLEVLDLAVQNSEGDSQTSFGIQTASNPGRSNEAPRGAPPSLDHASTSSETFDCEAKIVQAFPSQEHRSPEDELCGDFASNVKVGEAKSKARPSSSRGGKQSKDAKDAKKTFKCNTCCIEFTEVKDHREHFKMEWHRVNLKRKVDGQEPLTQEEVENDPLLMMNDKSDLHEYC